VPHFADTLVQSIEFTPTDRVLDIGCGDGKFTTSFSPAVGYVMGVDSSPAMIEAAKKLDYGGAVTDFRVVDCRLLNKEADIVNGNWDKV
jgi:ubiquinone/menaquinone biosynthesis C-methylase UbiE